MPFVTLVHDPAQVLEQRGYLPGIVQFLCRVGVTRLFNIAEGIARPEPSYLLC